MEAQVLCEILAKKKWWRFLPKVGASCIRVYAHSDTIVSVCMHTAIRLHMNAALSVAGGLTTPGPPRNRAKAPIRPVLPCNICSLIRTTFSILWACVIKVLLL